MENAVVGLWHSEQFPPGLWEVRAREGSWDSCGRRHPHAKSFHLESLARVAHSRGGKFSSFLKDRASPLSAQQFCRAPWKDNTKPERGCQGDDCHALGKAWGVASPHPRSPGRRLPKPSWDRHPSSVGPVLKNQMCFLSTV